MKGRHITYWYLMCPLILAEDKRSGRGWGLKWGVQPMGARIGARVMDVWQVGGDWRGFSPLLSYPLHPPGPSISLISPSTPHPCPKKPPPCLHPHPVAPWQPPSPLPYPANTPPAGIWGVLEKQDNLWLIFDRRMIGTNPPTSQSIINVQSLEDAEAG